MKQLKTEKKGVIGSSLTSVNQNPGILLFLLVLIGSSPDKSSCPFTRMSYDSDRGFYIYDPSLTIPKEPEV